MSISNSEFSGNATQTTGPGGRGDILLYGFNGNVTMDNVTIQDPAAGAEKAFQIRGVQSASDVTNVGPYSDAGNVSLTNVSVSGNYSQDLMAFYRIADFQSFTTDNVTLDAAAPWGLMNFDEVGGTVDLSGDITATNLASGAPIAAIQGLASNDTFTGTMSGDNVFVARGGDDVLNGNGENNLFIAGTGNDTFNGGGGDNTYSFGSTFGQDIIDNASAMSTTPTGRIDFGSGLSETDLAFQQSGADLQIGLLGTQDSITIQGWYGTDASAQLQGVNFADGTTLTTAQIDQLASASGSGLHNGNYILGIGSGRATVSASDVTVVSVPASVALSSVILEADNSGDLTIELPDLGDSVTLTGDLRETWWGGVSSVVTTLTEIGGASITLGQPAQGEGQPFTFTWIGTASDTTLIGSDYGSNVFDLGAGGDAVTLGTTQDGGSGNNTLVFDKGDGRVAVNVNGGVSNGVVATLQMAADIAADDVILQADNSGDLTVALRDDPADSVTFTGGLKETWWGGVSSVVTTLEIGGSSIALGQPAQGQGQPFTFTWIGTVSDTTLIGSDYGSNVFDLGAGGDTITLGTTQDGGSGNNTLVFDKGDGQVTVNVNGGISNGVVATLQMAADIAADDVILQADNSGDLTVALRDDPADSVTFTGGLKETWWGGVSSVVTILEIGGSSITLGQPAQGQGQPFTFTWIGTASDATLIGSDYGSNVFDLGAGGDTITLGTTQDGGSGENTIAFDKGDGQVIVNVNGGTSNGVVATLQMASDIVDDDVVLQADDLGDLTVVLRDDTADSVTFHGDLNQKYYGVNSVLQQIAFADGTTMAVGQPASGEGQPLTFTWIGSASDTTLTGSDYGSNVFDLGTGGDTVTFGNTNDGGSGNNTLAFDKGDGRATVNLNSGIGVLQVGPDITESDIIFQSDSAGDLIIGLADDPSDSVTILNDLQQKYYGVYSALQEIEFANGTSMAVGEPAPGEGAPLTFTSVGTATNALLYGSNYGGNNFLLAAVGGGGGGGGGSFLGDTVFFGNTNSGGSGYNSVSFDKGDGQVYVNPNSGVGTITMASDIAASDVYLQADSSGNLYILLRDDSSDSIIVNGDLVQRSWGTSSQITDVTFADGSTLAIGQPSYSVPVETPTFTWIGSGSSETLTGSSFGNNVFDDGGGNDVLSGVGGYDTYKFGSSFGQTNINNNTSTGSPNGEIDFGAGINSSQLWLEQTGNKLQIDLLGTHDSITVDNWYSGNTGNQVKSVTAGDGLTIDSQLQQLVSAMATYTANNPGFDPTQTSQMPTDSSLQSAIAAAWHH